MFNKIIEFMSTIDIIMAYSLTIAVAFSLVIIVSVAIYSIEKRG